MARNVTIWALAAAALAGCSSYDGDKVRREHVAQYQKTLTEQTATALKDHNDLAYADCIRLTLARNLDLQLAAIEQRIAKLQKGVAFANFLPTLGLQAQYYATDPQVLRQVLGMQVAFNDREVTQVSWQVRLNIFNPSTWFLYGLYSRGEEIADRVTQYTRQAIVLQTTVLYFQCLSLEESLKALHSQVAAAEATEKQVLSLHKEGVVTDSQAGQASLQIRAKRTEQAALARALAEAKAVLASDLGLSPMAEFSLRQDMPFDAVDRPLEDLVAEALLKQPGLQIADRKIAIEKEKVRLALAGFLPNVVGFANRVDSSDSFLVYSSYWEMGLAGVVNLFDGFANIDNYKAAKERKKEALVEREQQTLAVMVQVIRAYEALQSSQDQSALATQALEVASRRLTETRSKWEQGLVDASTFLSCQADRDRAQMNAMNARFQHQVSIATLLNAMGTIPVESKESSNDKPKS